MTLNSSYISYNDSISYPNTDAAVNLILDEIAQPRTTNNNNMESFMDDSMLLDFSTSVRQSKD